MDTTNDYTKYQAGLRKERRREGHLQRLGSTVPVCVLCGYAQPEALTGVDRRLLERHSLEGRHEGLMVTLCRNCHAELSDLQNDWDPALRSRDRDDPTRLAALLHGLGQFLIAVGHALIDWSARILREAWQPSFVGAPA